MRLILYSKPGCHLCEGLQEKLEQVQTLRFDLEIRDITTRDDWFQQYQYEIPVLMMDRGSDLEDLEELQDLSAKPQPLIPLPRLSPRSSVQQLEQMLQKFWNDPAQ